jgi:hypothetical protein
VIKTLWDTSLVALVVVPFANSSVREYQNSSKNGAYDYHSETRSITGSILCFKDKRSREVAWLELART